MNPDQLAKWLTQSTAFTQERDAPLHLQALGRRLLFGSSLEVKGVPCRLREVEFYLHQPGHLDPYTHRHARQQTTGHWYFHRVGNGFRGGTFKGLDLTLGSPETHGGVLLRSLETENGALIEGPSRVVDWLLRQIAAPSVAELAFRAESLPADHPKNVLRFRLTDLQRDGELLATTRVGLSPKKEGDPDELLRFLLKPYRFLRDPVGMKKGRAQMVLALLLRGCSPEAIHARLGTPRHVIRNFVTAMERGGRLRKPSQLPGRLPTGEHLAELQGWANQRWEPLPES